MVEHKMYCTLAAELSKDWDKVRVATRLGACSYEITRFAASALLRGGREIKGNNDAS